MGVTFDKAFGDALKPIDAELRGGGAAVGSRGLRAGGQGARVALVGVVVAGEGEVVRAARVRH